MGIRNFFFFSLVILGVVGCDSNFQGQELSGVFSNSDNNDLVTEATLTKTQIGTFNLMRLTPVNKNFARIVEMVDESDLHIFSAIELMSIDGSNTLLAELNSNSIYNWEMSLSKINNGETTYKEWFAYYYRTDFVKPITTGDLFCDTSAAASQQENTCYAKDYYDDGPDFSRDPFVGHFQIGRSKFTLVSVHLHYGGHDQDSIKARLKEMKYLRKVVNKVKKNTPKHDVILLGDFNLRLVEEVIWEDVPETADIEAENRVKAEVPESFIDQVPHLNSIITEATTVGHANYDHIFYFADNKHHVIEDSYGAYMDFDLNSTHQKNKYKSEVSDHFLIRASFNLAK
jgi:hypothetical protein